jgi:dUTP pyrophosphatase
MQVKVHVADGGTKPNKATSSDAAYDITASEDCEVSFGQVTVVPTGLFFQFPEGFVLQVLPRSGLAAKHGITVLNSPGTIDSGYRGELKVILAKVTEGVHSIKKGDRVAQLQFLALANPPELSFVDRSDLSETDRGQGGLGSTGR